MAVVLVSVCPCALGVGGLSGLREEGLGTGLLCLTEETLGAWTPGSDGGEAEGLDS